MHLEAHMSYTRTTNVLLFIIAISLVVIAAKPLLDTIIHEAKAENSSNWISGCYRSYDGAGCKSVPIIVDEFGRIIISNVK
jgi:hypothetical protein